MSDTPSDHGFEEAVERYLTADPDAVANPFPMFADLRQKSPVHFVESAGVWLVTRYEDICAVARNPAVFSSRSATGLCGPVQHAERNGLAHRAVHRRHNCSGPRLSTPIRSCAPDGTLRVVRVAALPPKLTYNLLASNH